MTELGFDADDSKSRRGAGNGVKRHSGIIARLRVKHEHKCEIGLDSETQLWVGNHAVEGDVWRCGDCGATYVWHGPHNSYPSDPGGDWKPATKQELRAIETGEEVPFRDR